MTSGQLRRINRKQQRDFRVALLLMLLSTLLLASVIVWLGERAARAAVAGCDVMSATVEGIPW